MHRLHIHSTRSLIPVFLFSLFITSCSQRSDTKEAVIKAMEESLESSSKTYNAGTMQAIYSLTEKANDPATMEKAVIWLPKAKQVQSLSTEIFNYIEGLKSKKSIDVETSASLYNELLSYKEKVLAVDSSIKYEFSKSIYTISSSFETAESDHKQFYKTYFRNADTTSTKAMLSKLQNNIRAIEYKTLLFCNERFTNHSIIDYFPASLIGQNTKALRFGETLEINAGIGNFTSLSEQSIIINGQKIEIRDNGIATYKMKIKANPGLYKIPVRLSFINPGTGKEEVHETTVEYTVIKPCDQ